MSRYDHECSGCGDNINTRRHQYEYRKTVLINDGKRDVVETYSCSKCAKLEEHDHDKELEEDMKNTRTDGHNMSQIWDEKTHPFSSFWFYDQNPFIVSKPIII